MSLIKQESKSYVTALLVASFCLLVASVTIAVTRIAPEEVAMGPSQRIVYVHVAVAWFSLLAFIVMAATSFTYLVRRNLAWDAWAHASAEIGWMCSGLTLLSGAIWAHEAWGTWWTWDPRLTTFFVLWLVYTGILLLRRGFTDIQRRARTSAVISIVGLADVPLVVMATRWFRGMHPVAPEMETSMRFVLLFTVLVFTAFFLLLLAVRQRQLRCELRFVLSAWETDNPNENQRVDPLMV